MWVYGSRNGHRFSDEFSHDLGTVSWFSLSGNHKELRILDFRAAKFISSLLCVYLSTHLAERCQIWDMSWVIDSSRVNQEKHYGGIRQGQCARTSWLYECTGSHDDCTTIALNRTMNARKNTTSALRFHLAIALRTEPAHYDALRCIAIARFHSVYRGAAVFLYLCWRVIQ